MIERARLERRTLGSGERAIAVVILAGEYSGIEFWLDRGLSVEEIRRGEIQVGANVIAEFEPADQFAHVVDPFPKFLASAKETDERSPEGHDLKDGEICVRLGGDMFAVKRPDGTYWTCTLMDESEGTLEHVARALFDYALDEGIWS